MKYLSLIVSFLLLNIFLSAQVSQANEDFRTDTIDKSFDFDIGIEAERVNFWSTGEIFGESGFYGQLPITQIMGADNNIISFSAIIKNYGTVAATPQLNISVRDQDDEEVYSQLVILDYALGPGESDTLTTEAPYFDISVCYQIGYIKYDFSVSILEAVDENLDNNAKSDSTKVTQWDFARDNNNVTDSISTCDFTGGCNNGDAIGVVYELIESESFGSIDVWISETASIGSLFVAKILARDESLNDWVEIASSALIYVNEEDLGSIITCYTVENCFVDVPYNEKVEILVALECYYESDQSELVIGTDQTTPTNGYENWIKLGSENIWTPMESNFAPIIRITRSWDNYVNNANMDHLSLFPNPTSGILQTENFQTQFVEVLNIDGQIVKTCEFNTNVSEIDISELENGTYFLKLSVNDEFIVKKVILIK
jgi:hypothetical protein